MGSFSHTGRTVPPALFLSQLVNFSCGEFFFAKFSLPTRKFQQFSKILKFSSFFFRKKIFCYFFSGFFCLARVWEILFFFDFFFVYLAVSAPPAPLVGRANFSFFFLKFFFRSRSWCRENYFRWSVHGQKMNDFFKKIFFSIIFICDKKRYFFYEDFLSKKWFIFLAKKKISMILLTKKYNFWNWFSLFFFDKKWKLLGQNFRFWIKCFLTGSTLLYQIWPPKCYLNSDLHIILKYHFSRHLEICKHSSFFNLLTKLSFKSNLKFRHLKRIIFSLLFNQ